MTISAEASKQFWQSPTWRFGEGPKEDQRWVSTIISELRTSLSMCMCMILSIKQEICATIIFVPCKLFWACIKLTWGKGTKTEENINKKKKRRLKRKVDELNGKN